MVVVAELELKMHSGDKVYLPLPGSTASTEIELKEGCKASSSAEP